MSRITRHAGSTVHRRSFLKGIAAGGVALGVFAGTATAKPGRGRGRGSCDAVVDAGGGGDYTSIQAAVDAAATGDAICVRDGTYQEQVVIGKSLMVRAAEGASPTVLAPSSPAEYTIAESGASWEPVVFAYGGTESGGDVSGGGTSDITVSGLSIDGDDRQPGADRSSGVLARNVRGNVLGNEVAAMGVGGKETFGVVAYGPETELTIAGNDVSGFERGGIGANGDGSGPGPTVRIDGNAIVGSPGGGWAPNGIQVGFGATGRVSNNVTRDNRWSGSDWNASGVLIFEADGVRVHDNRMFDNDVGCGISSWHWFLTSADRSSFVGNEIDGANIGVDIQAVAWDGFSTGDPTANNNKVVNNTITDDDGDYGVSILAYDGSATYDPEADNNKVIRNDIDGFAVPVGDNGSATKVHANDP